MNSFQKLTDRRCRCPVVVKVTRRDNGGLGTSSLWPPLAPSNTRRGLLSTVQVASSQSFAKLTLRYLQLY